MPSLTVAQLAEISGGLAEGDLTRVVNSANTLEAAGPHEVAFVANKKLVSLAANSRAGCLVVDASFDLEGKWSLIRVPQPRAAFVRLLGTLYPSTPFLPGIHPSAVISDTAQLAAGCFIGAHTFVGQNARIGEGCYIGDGTHIGKDASIGARSFIHSRATIYNGVRIGSDVTIHAGVVIGADGFGFTLTDNGYEKFPQVGTVEIEDRVEIGANCCIDRAALGVTRIGYGTKLDNLVHVAHNCNIGRHVVIAAQTGISGSVTVEDYAVIGGQVGIGEKAFIASKAVVGGKSGILTSQKIAAGEPVWGIPARPLKQHLKGLAHIGKMPELRDEVLKLRRRLDLLERNPGE